MSSASSNTPENRSVWESLYARSEKVNRYPYDGVVTFVMRNFAAVPDRSTIRLLDYGCGGGGNTAFMATEGFETHAIDSAAAAAIHTRRTVAMASRRPATVVVGDFAALPYPDNFFDAVIDRQSLGQNPGSRLPIMVAEIGRVLKTGGFYFGINFSRGHPQLHLGETSGGGDYTNFSAGVFKGIGSRHFFDEADIRDLFADFQLRDIRLLRNTSLLDPIKGSEEILVTAVKPI